MKRSKTGPLHHPHQHIVAAAADVFASRGFEGARIDEIAERAGVNKAMLYYHVGDKERLYSAVLLESMERALSLLRAAAETGGSPSEKLQAILDTFAAFGTSNPAFIPIMHARGRLRRPATCRTRCSCGWRTVLHIVHETSWPKESSAGSSVPPIPFSPMSRSSGP